MTLASFVLIIIWLISLFILIFIFIEVYREKHKIIYLQLFPHIIRCDCKEKRRKKK